MTLHAGLLGMEVTEVSASRIRMTHTRYEPVWDGLSFGRFSYLFLSCRYSYRCVFVGVGCVVIKLSFSVDDWLAPDLVTVCSARSAQVVVIRRPDAAFSVRTQRRGVLAA